jgi:lipid A disaccharide synthetase
MERRNAHTHKTAHESGLTAARFAGNTKDFALGNRKGDVSHCMELFAKAAQIVEAQVIDFKNYI